MGAADEPSPLSQPRIGRRGLKPRPLGQMGGFVLFVWRAGEGSVCIKPAAAQAAIVNTLSHTQTDAHSQGRGETERKWYSGASSRHLSHPAMATFVSVSFPPHLADLRAEVRLDHFTASLLKLLCFFLFLFKQI